MDQQISVIKEKLIELKRKDSAFQVFGASSHRYQSNGRLYENEVKSFEITYNIELPPDYREFILQIENGGAGPYYGLESLEDGIYQDLDYKRKADLVNPSLEFPFTEAWNMDYHNEAEDKPDQMKEEEYFDSKWANGLLRISNFGCGVSMNLVVNGKEYGNIWVDDRCSDGGIYPDQYFGNQGRISFLAWYDKWLDRSLAEVSSLGNVIGEIKSPVKASKSWWKSIFIKA
jgi:hypothetical protein